MDIVAQEKGKNKRYLPHTLSTKEGAVKLYRQTKDIDFVLRRYHISKASLMRWNKAYDGTKESLTAKSSPCFPAVREGKRPAKRERALSVYLKKQEKRLSKQEDFHTQACYTKTVESV